MAKGIRRHLKQVAAAVSAEIKGMHDDSGGRFATLAGEGYAGGYRQALSDVELALNGIKPNTRWWNNVNMGGE